MTIEQLTALLSLFGTFIGTFAGILTSNKLTNYRILQLEKRVDKHNMVVDRTYKLEQRSALLEEEIKVANHRISDLENQK